MSNPHPECFFAKVFFAEGDTIPDVAPHIPEGASEEEALQALETKVCPRRADCDLTAAALLGYVMAFGNVEPLDVIREQVPSDCAWNSVRHDGGLPPISS